MFTGPSLTDVSIGKYYSQEQLLSVQAFSMMRMWLSRHYLSDSADDGESVVGPLDSLMKVQARLSLFLTVASGRYC